MHLPLVTAMVATVQFPQCGFANDGFNYKLILRSLRDVHEMNAYRVDHACVSVCPSIRPHYLTREPLDEFG
jgi:hypothetical protein